MRVLAWPEMELAAVDEFNGYRCAAARMVNRLLCCHRPLLFLLLPHTLSSHLLLLPQKLWVFWLHKTCGWLRSEKCAFSSFPRGIHAASSEELALVHI